MNDNQNIHETAATVSMDETQKSFCEQTNDSTDFSHIYDGREKGWISLYRSLLDHWIWLSGPFTRGQAFVDLLLMANHANHSVILNRQHFEIKRGQVARSILTLSKRWKWGRPKVTLFLKLLAKEGMITFETNNATTIITICNYNKHQGIPINEQTPIYTTKRHRMNNKPDTNNKNKKKNNDKNSVTSLYGKHEAEGSFWEKHLDTSWRPDFDDKELEPVT